MGWHPVRDEGGDAAQRGLFAGGAAALGDVVCGGVDEAVPGDRAGAPLEPAFGAVGPQEAVLELGQGDAAGEPVEDGTRACAVLRVHELQPGAAEQRVGGVAEGPLEGGVHALEAAVQVRDAQQVQGEVEDAREFLLGLVASPLGRGEGGHGAVHAAEQLRPGPLERGDVRAVAEPVVVNGRVHGVDLARQPLGGDPQFPERVGDGAEFVPARVPDVVRQVALGERAGARGDLAEGAGDRQAQGQGEDRDGGEDGQRHAEVACLTRACRVQIARGVAAQLGGGPVLDAAQGVDAPGRGGQPTGVRGPGVLLGVRVGEGLAGGADDEPGVLEQGYVEPALEAGGRGLAEVVQERLLQGRPAVRGGGVRGVGGVEQHGQFGAFAFGGLDGVQERDVGVGGLPGGAGGPAGLQGGGQLQEVVLDRVVLGGELGRGERAGPQLEPQGVQLTVPRVEPARYVGRSGPAGGAQEGRVESVVGGVLRAGAFLQGGRSGPQPGLHGGDAFPGDGVGQHRCPEGQLGRRTEIPHRLRLAPLGDRAEHGERQQAGHREQHQEHQFAPDAQPGEERHAEGGAGPRGPFAGVVRGGAAGARAARLRGCGGRGGCGGCGGRGGAGLGAEPWKNPTERARGQGATHGGLSAARGRGISMMVGHVPSLHSISHDRQGVGEDGSLDIGHACVASDARCAGYPFPGRAWRPFSP